MKKAFLPGDAASFWRGYDVNYPVDELVVISKRSPLDFQIFSCIVYDSALSSS